MAKLEKLVAAIDVLDEIRPTNRQEFIHDKIKHGAAMFNLVISIE
jgi:hypothetical protein